MYVFIVVYRCVFFMNGNVVTLFSLYHCSVFQCFKKMRLPIICTSKRKNLQFQSGI